MQLAIIFALTGIIHAVETSAHAARLAGVRTGRLNVARSLYNVLALGARGASAISALLLGNLTDVAVAAGETGALIDGYRWVLAGAAVGTLIAAFLIPTLSRIIAQGVVSYEQRRSLPEVVVRATTVQGLWKMREAWMPPRVRTVGESRRRGLPRRLLLASIVVVALHTVSSPAALYASAVVPVGVRTATNLSALVNVTGTLLMILVVDPIAALVIDQALVSERPLRDATYLTIWQVGARLVGALLAQALLVPAGLFLSAVTRLLMG